MPLFLILFDFKYLPICEREQVRVFVCSLMFISIFSFPIKNTIWRVTELLRHLFVESARIVANEPSAAWTCKCFE